ncbi:redox-regulated ATPase YchF [Oceanotoga sp. DSM 15011]|jgi:hypothetical protein|uniref:Ribosome-binding ATPase YchF n=1 Tax=Oceanotoga teriensis TaxID=515440 RepID=A0AA45C9F9_9BACT|nr:MULTISPECIES: redox-regulated ATPase YchF [Oceanotoga]MDN5343666.1 ribosome-binding ATPase [Oceanotoga sp.]MDO7975350.1 redox-regulated ATPase YchF [Oceanotoga teriensis]PWJ96682.1 hypothetical protein C7380_101257 [Oceanotoga teriensis]UYP00146.1 redox-regulated ATPase YchF [Oceanotoga sp. DSM 15011]
MLKIGLVGLPNVGKSTLFNALSKQQVPAENYPFCTVEPNISIIEYKDFRLDKVSKLYNSAKKVNPTIQFVDIAGLVKGASNGEGLGNQFLDHISKVDAIAHVLRSFEDDNITHVSGKVDPIFDAEIIDFELIQKDLSTVQKRYEKTFKLARAGDKEARKEIEILEQIKGHLENTKPIRNFKKNERDEETQKIIDELFLLSEKPIIYVANIDDSENSKQLSKKIKEYSEEMESDYIEIPSKIISDINQMDEDDKEIFMEEFGIKNDILDDFILECKKLLKQITFITANENESKSWNINEGTTIYEAAGKIHTDIQKGFIKAEIINYQNLKELENLKIAKEKGIISIHGKEYILQEGDVIYIHFH